MDWKAELRNSTRGVLVTIDNNTDYTLVRTKYSIQYGVWKEVPQENIPPQSQVEFGTSSYGFVSGTEGSVHYTISNGDGEFRFHWNNPLIGVKNHNSSGPVSCVVESSSSSLSSLSTQLYYVAFTIVAIDKVEEGHSSSGDVMIKKNPSMDGTTVLQGNLSALSKIVASGSYNGLQSAILTEEAEQVNKLNGSRSVALTVVNNTSKILSRKVYSLLQGKWKIFPPEIINAFSSKHFTSESDIFATGTSGRIFYSIVFPKSSSVSQNESKSSDAFLKGSKEDSSALNPELPHHSEVPISMGKIVGEFELYWSNTFVGQSEFKSHMTNPNSLFLIEEQHEQGHNAKVTFTIRDAKKSRTNSMKRVELSTSKEIFPDCYLCGRTFDDRKRYCVDCFRGISEENRSDISKKILLLRSAKEENEQLREKTVFETIQNHDEINKLRISKDNAIRRVKHLQERIEAMKKHTKSKQNEIERIHFDFHSKKLEMIENNKKLDHLLVKFTSRTPKIVMKQKEKIERLYSKLSQHRKYLIVELLSFFPLNPVSELEYAIVNIKLPYSYLSWIELPVEGVATALGYIVHLLSVACLYLDICLPYKMQFVGSRSKIWREGSSKQYLLYKDDEEDFRVALEMLNWNVVHFCLFQGVAITVEKQDFTLANLLIALRSPLLGLQGPHFEDTEFIEGKARSLSLSTSLTMPAISSDSSPNVPNPSKSREGKPKSEKKDSEEDFVIIVPPPTSSETEIQEFEKAMFLDKI